MEVTLQETANEINKMKRSFLLILLVVAVETEFVSQEIIYKRKFEVGSPLRIRPKTTFLPVGRITVGLQNGSPNPTLSRNGTQRVLSCGSMESVRLFPVWHPIMLLIAPNLLICSGLWQEYSLVRVNPHYISLAYS